MNKALIAAMLAVTAGSVAHLNGQGTVNWGNAFGTTTTGLRAPVYNVNPADPTRQVQGNGPLGVPAGNANYGGAPLLEGTGFTIALYTGPSVTAAMAQQIPTDMTSFRTGTAAAGLILSRVAIVQGIGPSLVAGAQFRAWDNRGGTVTSWAAVMADPGIPHGQSEAFLTGGLGGPNPAGGPDITPPQTTGARSFNLVVPEPSLIALGALALGGLLLRRRK